jgi:hypothetical protein
MQVRGNAPTLFSQFIIINLRCIQSDTPPNSQVKCATMLQRFSFIVQIRTHLPLTHFFPFASIQFLRHFPARFHVKAYEWCVRGRSSNDIGGLVGAEHGIGSAGQQPGCFAAGQQPLGCSRSAATRRRPKWSNSVQEFPCSGQAPVSWLRFTPGPEFVQSHSPHRSERHF